MTQFAVVWPLALGALRRSWPRQALMAAILGLAIAAYLLYATFLTGAGQEARLLVESLDLPCDLVFLGKSTLSQAEIETVMRNASVTLCETARSTWYLTAAGYVRVLALRESSSLWGLLAGPGGAEEAPPVPGRGEVLIPSWAAELSGLAVGQGFVLSPPRVPTAGSALRIAGVHQTADDLLGHCAFTLLPEAGPAPNALFVWMATPEAAAPLAWNLEQEYVRPGRPVVRTMDDPVILTAGLPDRMARSVLAQTYLPGAGVMMLVFGFCGIGLFTTVSLGFMDRRRSIAILKTVGMESAGVVTMLAVEQGLVAVAGTVLGSAIAAAAVPGLAAYFPGQPVLLWSSIIKGALAGVFVLGAAVFVPAASARVATVNQLLYNLPVPLMTRRISGQTGE